MQDDFSDIKAAGAEKIPDDSVKVENNKFNMKEVTSMGAVSAKETTDLLVALAKIAVSIKESIDDDGKFTPADAVHFIDDIFPLIDGITGIDKIPAEFKDGFDDIEKADMKNKVSAALKGIAVNDEAAVDAGLDVIFALQKFFLVSGVIKPAQTGDANATAPN